jgi:hypothetical protein
MYLKVLDNDEMKHAQKQAGTIYMSAKVNIVTSF